MEQTEFGRKGFEKALAVMKSDIMAGASPDIVKQQDTWLNMALVSIANNEDLKPLLQTKEGMFSIIKCMQSAAKLGLYIGGNFPHCYILVYADKASLIITSHGYKHTALHSSGATLEDIEVSRVYEGDKVTIDKAACTVSHIIDPMTERGKLVGVYAIITKKNGKKVIEYFSKKRALEIRDNSSKSWKNGRSTPWKTDEDAMVEKTALHYFLRPYASEAEGLSLAYSVDDTNDMMRDVTERMAKRLDEKLNVPEIAEVKEEKEMKNIALDDADVEACVELLEKELF